MSRGHGAVQREVLRILASIATNFPGSYVRLTQLAGGTNASRSDVEKTRSAIKKLEAEGRLEVRKVQSGATDSVVLRLKDSANPSQLSERAETTVLLALSAAVSGVNHDLRIIGSRHRLELRRVDEVETAFVADLDQPDLVLTGIYLYPPEAEQTRAELDALQASIKELVKKQTW